jgi:hypothetical protein
MSTNHMYFDLLHFTKTLGSEYVAAAVARQIAWRIDAAIASNCRSMLRTVRELIAEEGGAAGRAELETVFSEAAAAEQWFGKMAGLDDGPLETVRALHAVRDQWHAAAAELVSLTIGYDGKPRVYTTPDIDDAFFDRRPEARVNTQAKMRIQFSVNAHVKAAGMDATMAGKLVERRLARAQEQAENMRVGMNHMAPFARLMLTLTLQSDESEASERCVTGFAGLPIEAQRMLIVAAGQALSRADSDAAGERSMTDLEFERVVMTVLKAQPVLDQVLRSPRFMADQQAAERVL